MNEQAIYLTRGLPASGKSTWAEQHLALCPEFVRVERDLLRDQLFGHRDYSRLTSDNENTVTVLQKAMVQAALKAGKSVIISDTNLRAAYVREWAKLAAENGVGFNVINFDDVTVDECVSRDNGRINSVGEEVIRTMASKFLKKGKLVPVVITTEPEVVADPYIPVAGTPKAIIVDIDGTLANMSGRSPYEWMRVGEDTPVQSVINAVHAARQFGRKVIVMSGRDAACREITEEWLTKYLGVSWDELFMRPAGDNRKDNIIKQELFDNNVRYVYDVEYVLDDRNQVVKMWRSLGLNCFQVAEGNF